MWRGTPDRQQLAQIDQFLVEFFQEHVADIVVDIAVAKAAEDAGIGTGLGRLAHCRLGRCLHSLTVGIGGLLYLRTLHIELRGGSVELGQKRRRCGVQFELADHRLLHARCALLGGVVSRGWLRFGRGVDERVVQLLRRHGRQRRRRERILDAGLRAAGLGLRDEVQRCLALVGIAGQLDLLDLQRRRFGNRRRGAVVLLQRTQIHGVADLRGIGRHAAVLLGRHRVEHRGGDRCRVLGGFQLPVAGRLLAIVGQVQRRNRKRHVRLTGDGFFGGDRVEREHRVDGGSAGVVHHAGGKRRLDHGFVGPFQRQRRGSGLLCERCGERLGHAARLVGTDRQVGRLARGQRPVAQRFQAVAGDVQDLLAAGTALAQGFQVVLQAGHRIGQRVQLATAGHALLADQFQVDITAHAFQIIGGLRQLEDAQRTADFAEQMRHVGQAGVVPVGLDEGDEMLARRTEIGDRLLRQHVHRAPHFRGGSAVAGFIAVADIGAQAGDLVIQRGIDIQQRAGDIQQHAFVHLHLAVDHARQRIALLHDHIARHAQAHHAQGVGNAAEILDLGLQFGDLAAGPQVQVQRVLDAQQFFLDRIADGVEQLAIASAQAAARVIQFGLGGDAGLRIEREQHAFAQTGLTTRGTDFIEQRQQHDRNVAVTVLQTLQVVGQQHGAAHQHGAGFVAVGHLADLHRLGQQLEFFGHHRRGVQLDHAQGALHLVQIAGAEAHPTGVGRFFGKVLDLVARLAQRLVQLRLDPAQRGVTHRIAKRTHCSPLPTAGVPPRRPPVCSCIDVTLRAIC